MFSYICEKNRLSFFDQFGRGSYFFTWNIEHV
jgi:hypothetical protein